MAATSSNSGKRKANNKYTTEQYKKRKNQTQVKCTYPENVVRIVNKDDGLYTCRCGASFEVPATIQRHAKTCVNGTPIDYSSDDVSELELHVIIPEDDNIVELPDMKDFEIKWHRILGKPICSRCHVPLNIDSIGRHLNRVHRVMKFSKYLEDRLKLYETENPGIRLDNYLKPKSILLKPISGLQYEVDGFKCLLCQNEIFHCSRFSTMRKHIANDHRNIPISVNEKFEKCHVQTLGSLNKGKYFGISDPEFVSKRTARELNHGNLNQIRDEIRSSMQPVQVNETSEDIKLHSKHIYLIKTQWDIYVAENFEKNADYLRDHQGIDPEKLRHLCFEYVKGAAYKHRLRIHYNILKQLNKNCVDDESNSTGFGKSIFKPVENETMIRYTRNFADLLEFVILKCKMENHENLPNKWKDIIEKAQELYAKFSSDTYCVGDLHIFAKAIYCLKFGKAESSFNDPVIQFCIFSNHDGKKSGYDLKSLGRLYASLMYCFRGVAINILCLDYNAEEATDGQVDYVLSFVKSNSNTPFTNMLLHAGMAKSLQADEDIGIKIMWLDLENFMQLDIDGKTVTVDLLRKVVKDLSTKAERLLEKITFGFSNKLLSDNRIKWIDQVTNQQLGYSWLSDPDNPVSTIASAFTEYILGRKDLLRRFVNHVNDDGINWNIDALRRWLEDSSKIVDIFVGLIHITCGQPSRATELELTTIRNTHDALRSLYFRNGVFMIYQSYTKTRNLTNSSKRITRYLPGNVSSLLKTYLVVARQFEKFCAGKVFGDTERELYDSYLFVRNGTRMNASHLSTAFKRQLEQSGNLSLNISSYRQVAVAFLEKHVHPKNFDPTVVMHSQAGHSAATVALHYAQSQQDLPTMSRHEDLNNRRTSILWHEFLRLDTPSINASTETSTNQTPINSDTYPRISTSESLRSSPLTSISSQQSLPRKYEYIEFEKIHNAFLQFMKKDDAKFRNLSQCEFLHEVVNCTRDLLIVMPTGSGKSLSFFLPVLLEQFVTVLVVPLVSLTQDILQRCHRADIRCVKWTKATPYEIKSTLILVSVEQCGYAEFKQWIKMCHSHGNLRRVIIDEAHLCITDDDYRPAFNNIYEIREVDFPIIALTATMPSDMVVELEKKLHCDFKVIRTSTLRKNISYRVHHLKQENDETDELISWIRNQKNFIGDGRIVIFCQTRLACEEVQKSLNESEQTWAGSRVLTYHAGMEADKRMEHMGKFIRNEAQIMVATNAFGAGVDISNIRLVAHLGNPKSLLNFAQESGRGGRNGKKTISIIFSSNHRKVGGKIGSFLNETNCRRKIMTQYLDGIGYTCRSYPEETQKCDLCIQSVPVSNLQSDNNIFRVPGSAERRSTFQTPALTTIRPNNVTPMIQSSPLIFKTMIKTSIKKSSMNDIGWTIKNWLQEHLTRCPLDCNDHLIGNPTQPFKNCNEIKGRCFKCLYPTTGPHKCFSYYKYNGACYRCHLPMKIGEYTFHKSSSSFGNGRCQTANPGYTDKVKTFVWKNIWDDENSPEILEKCGYQGNPTDAKQIGQWFIENNTKHDIQITNMITFMYEILRDKENIYWEF